MKYWYIGAVALVVAAAVGLTLYRKKPATNPQVDGGVRHYVDESLPKEIQSTQIIYFHCKFSSMARSMADTPIAGQVFTLTATEESCTCKIRDRSKEIISETFVPDANFFGQLQQIVSRHDMARENGQHYRVSGLPPDFGIDLEVRYSSGEVIRTSNNQSCFLSNEAMEELAALFQRK